MDRRAFMMTGAWLPTVSGALPWMTHAAVARNTLAVVDTSLAGGRAFSQDAARRDISVFEINNDSGDDIGTLWYSTLAPRLVAAPGLLIGVARASDYFVLGELALRSMGLVEHRCQRCTGQNTPVAFLLAPAATRRRSA
jgi:hypothetical protein